MIDVSMDIETTGLSPWEDQAVTAAFVGSEGDSMEVFDEPDDEVALLEQIEAYMRGTQIDKLVGWNHTEFDLPFLAVRFVLNGIDLPPFLKPTDAKGKYGKPIYEGAWYGAKFHDIAYDFEKEVKDAGVRWSLKPFAEFKGLGKGMEVNFNEEVETGETVRCIHDTDSQGKLHPYDLVTRPFTILDLDKDVRKLYCASDAQLAMGLYLELPPASKRQGQAVTLSGGLTIL